MSQVDVIIVVDTATILALKPPGSEANPSSVPADTIYMIANLGNVQSGEASPGLNLNVQIGDTIRWWATSLTLDTMFAVVICEINPTYTSGPDLISPPQGQILPLKAFTLNNPPSAAMTPQDINICVWIAEARNSGRISQRIKFAIIDDKGVPIGYYYWDPLITIGSG